MQLRIIQLDEIQKKLMEIPPLINMYGEKDNSFFFSVENWLLKVEEILSNNRKVEVAQIASLRSLLISAKRGIFPDNFFSKKSKSNRVLMDITASSVLREAENIITNSIRNDKIQFEEGERIARQLVLLGYKKGIIFSEKMTGSHENSISLIWQRLFSDNETGNVASHLSGLVGLQDALIIVDSIIEQLKYDIKKINEK